MKKLNYYDMKNKLYIYIYVFRGILFSEINLGIEVLQNFHY